MYGVHAGVRRELVTTHQQGLDSMHSQDIDEAVQSLENFRMARVADEDRMATAQRDKMIGHQGTAKPIVAADHHVGVTLRVRSPYHHRQAQLVEPMHRVLVYALAKQDESVSGLHRRP